MDHKWHKCDDERCFVCNNNLNLCETCGCGEGELPTECPGYNLPIHVKNMTYHSGFDLVDGEWFFKNVVVLKTGDHEMRQKRCVSCNLPSTILTTECCGHELDVRAKKAIEKGQLDFLDGEWEVILPISEQRKLSKAS